MRLFDVGECFGRRWGLQGAKEGTILGDHLSGQFDFGTLFGPKRHQNGAQRHAKIVKKNTLDFGCIFHRFRTPEKCQKDTAFSSKISSFRRKSKFAYLRRKCTSLKRNVRIWGSGPSKMRLFDVGECFGRRRGLQGSKKVPFWVAMLQHTSILGFFLDQKGTWMEAKGKRKTTKNHTRFRMYFSSLSGTTKVPKGHRF